MSLVQMYVLAFWLRCMTQQYGHCNRFKMNGYHSAYKIGRRKRETLDHWQSFAQITCTNSSLQSTISTSNQT